MATKPASKAPRDTAEIGLVNLSMKVTPEVRKRFKLAALQADMTQAAYLESLLPPLPRK